MTKATQEDLKFEYDERRAICEVDGIHPHDAVRAAWDQIKDRSKGMPQYVIKDFEATRKK
jgi:hypothetical protein